MADSQPILHVSTGCALSWQASLTFFLCSSVHDKASCHTLSCRKAWHKDYEKYASGLQAWGQAPVMNVQTMCSHDIIGVLMLWPVVWLAKSRSAPWHGGDHNLPNRPLLMGKSLLSSTWGVSACSVVSCRHIRYWHQPCALQNFTFQ